MSTFVSDILALVFGNISLVISVAIELPQLIAIFKTRNTSGTSLISYILFGIASLLGVTGASVFYVGSLSHVEADVTNLTLHISALLPVILSNLINTSFLCCILYFKIKHIYICKKLNITELAYSKILFDKQKGSSGIKKYYPILIISFIVLVACVALSACLYSIGKLEQISDAEYDLRFKKTIFILNIAAAVFFETISGPQFIKCMRTKDTSGISLGGAICLPLSCVVCFSYDLFLAFSTGFGNVLASLICSGIVINTAVLVLKIINIRKAKKLGLSEGTYTNKYVIKNRKHK